ncbi:MAG: AMP-binding protein [Bacteroidetes bacterium]|nr:AMP-binding protein [Bacteroidota bacterium]
MTPLDQLADSLHNYEDEPAFCIGDKYYSYSNFRKTIAGIQQQIAETGLTGHRNIGILAYDDIETYASVFAILYMGHAFVPVNPLHPLERNKEIIHQSDIALLLSGKDDTIARNLSSEKTKLIFTGDQSSQGDFIQVPLSPYQNAYILFTSGSTGAPKGVPITINNLNAFLDAFFSIGYKVDYHDRFIQMFDLTFDLSIMGYMAPLCIGACIYTVPPDAIKYVHVYKLLEKYQITFALLVPSILISLREYFPEMNLPKLRYSLFCGEALYEDIAMEWSKCIPGATIQNVYGPTEATIFCMLYNVSRSGNNKSLNGILCIGKPMKNTEVFIAGDNFKPMPSGEKGELCLSGDQVTSGYWKNESINKEAFFNAEGSRYYRSGDLCYCDADGDHYYSGRIDFQVKINGFRVELSEIEHHARGFLKNHDVVALAGETEGRTAQIYIFAEQFHAGFDTLNDYLKTKLPSYMIPSKYFSVDKFPLNSNGKVDRKALVKMFS